VLQPWFWYPRQLPSALPPKLKGLGTPQETNSVSLGLQFVPLCHEIIDCEKAKYSNEAMLILQYHQSQGCEEGQFISTSNILQVQCHQGDIQQGWYTLRSTVLHAFH